MAKTWDQFLPQVRRHVAGCPEPLMEDAVRSAVRDFCMKTQAWRANLAYVSSVANQRDYPLTPPAGTLLVAPISVYYNGQSVDPATEDMLDGVDGTWRYSTDKSVQPSHYLFMSPATISFDPIPETVIVDAIKVRAAVMPSPTGADCDDEIYDKYVEDIGNGAAGILLAIPDKPWTNLVAAAKHENALKRAITRAFLGIGQKGRTNVPNQVNFRPFGF